MSTLADNQTAPAAEKLTLDQWAGRVEDRLTLLERKVEFVMTAIRLTLGSPLAGMPPRQITMLEQFAQHERARSLQAQGLEPSRIVQV